MSDQETTALQLSERELEVVRLLATGASNQQVALELVISVNTVKVHLRKIYEKLGVQSRTEAVMVAIQEGWVSVSDDDDSDPGESTAKTFLVTEPQPALKPWQQFYLGAAVVLALVTLIVPLLQKNTSAASIPYLPVIEVSEDKLYEQRPTATPPAAATGRKNRWESLKTMPAPRAGLGVIAYQEKIYAIGGVRNNNRATRLVEIYDPKTDTWDEGAAKPTAATNIGGAILNDKIYVPGGCTNDGQAIDSLEIYDPQRDRWDTARALPAARCGYGLVGLEERLYLLGGWDGERFTASIFVYSPADDQWQVLDAALPEPKGYMGAAVLDNKIYVAGGYDGQKEFNETYRFDAQTHKWTELAPMNEDRGGLGLMSAVGNLYAIGGGWKQAVTVSEKYDAANDTWTTFESPFTDRWRNAGFTAIDTKLYAIGGWNDSEAAYMDSVVAYPVLYQLFIPISSFDK